MKRLGAALLVSALLLSIARLASASCTTDDPDGSKVAAARAQVAQDCVCEHADPITVNHGQYVKCAVGVAQARSDLDPSDPNFLPKTCKGAVKKCAARSSCGKPGFVTCCITTDTGTKCKTKKDETHCTDKLGVVSPCSSCCDACPAPGSGPSCPGASTTTTTTTTPESTTTTTISCHFDETNFVCGGDCDAGFTCGTFFGEPGNCQCIANDLLCFSPGGAGTCSNTACPGPNAYDTCDINPNTDTCMCFQPCGANPTNCEGVCAPVAGGAVPRVCDGNPGACRCCIPSGGPCFGDGDCCGNLCDTGTCVL